MPWNLALLMISATLGTGLVAYFIWSFSQFRRLNQQCATKQQQLEAGKENQAQLTAELTQLKNHFEQRVLLDPVTSLPSRQVYEDRLQQAIHQSQQHQLHFAIFILSIDDFEMINNVLGYDMGDVLLKEVASRLQTCVRKVDIICRFTDEKFAFLLPQTAKPETVAYVTKRILEVMAEPFHIMQQNLFLTASIGIAVYPTDGDEAKKLLKNADTALLQAETSGGNIYQFYHQNLYDMHRRELILNSSLHNDSIYQEFVIYYQPQVDVMQKEIVSMEALLRWQHPELGLVPPRDFLRLAEHNGTIIEIGEWVLRQACQQFLQWKLLGLHLKNIAVNVSMYQLESPQFTYRVSQILQEYKLDPSCLIFEVSESALLPKVELVDKTLRMLKHLGVKIAIDDFGTGYLSLQNLQRFRADYLKIDNMLTQHMVTDKESKAIVKMIITLSHNLDMLAVAEGVETQEQKQLLQELGCNVMQGHLFSHPLLPQEFTKMVVKNISELG